jgi:hypothetical protein
VSESGLFGGAVSSGADSPRHCRSNNKVEVCAKTKNEKKVCSGGAPGTEVSHVSPERGALPLEQYGPDGDGSTGPAPTLQQL